MLHRQRILLDLLVRVDRPVKRLELVKWCFLLSQDYPSKGGSAFYEFLPYHYGPYSFTLKWETEKLISHGLIEPFGDDAWQATTAGKDKFLNIPTNVGIDIDQLLLRHQNQPTDELLDHVYGTHTWYASRSKRSDAKRRKKGKIAVYTAGYESLHVDGFLNMLLAHDIRNIIDVRKNPIARRFGFHRSTLTRLSSNVGISYLHLPELGIEGAARNGLQTTLDFQNLFQTYEKTTLKTETHAIDQAIETLTNSPSVLICREAHHTDCHRHKLAETIAQKTDLPIRHLPIAN